MPAARQHVFLPLPWHPVVLLHPQVPRSAAFGCGGVKGVVGGPRLSLVSSSSSSHLLVFSRVAKKGGCGDRGEPWLCSMVSYTAGHARRVDYRNWWLGKVRRPPHGLLLPLSRRPAGGAQDPLQAELLMKSGCCGCGRCSCPYGRWFILVEDRAGTGSIREEIAEEFGSCARAI